MKLHSWDKVELENLSDTVSRRVIHSDRMTTARITVKKGGVVPRHSHENEQISHVLEGSVLFQFDDREITARAGDLVEIASNEPHRVEATLRTSSCFTSASPASGPNPVTTLTTPLGEPARSTSLMNSSVEAEVNSEGLITTVLPAASAGASFHAVSRSGEFQGMIATQTPRGSCSV